MKLLGIMIKQQREGKMMTLREMAGLAKLSPGYVSQLENGVADGTPSYETIEAIAEALEIDSAKLLVQAGFIPKGIQKIISGMILEGMSVGNIILLLTSDKAEICRQLDVAEKGWQKRHNECEDLKVKLNILAEKNDDLQEKIEELEKFTATHRLN